MKPSQIIDAAKAPWIQKDEDRYGFAEICFEGASVFDVNPEIFLDIEEARLPQGWQIFDTVINSNDYIEIICFVEINQTSDLIAEGVKVKELIETTISDYLA